MEVRRGDVVDTIWFKGAIVQRTKEDYSYVVFKPFMFHNIMFYDLWIDNKIIKCIYRRSSRHTEL